MGQFITRIRRSRRIGGNRYRWVDTNCTDADRELVAEWLMNRVAGTLELSVGPLKGAWSLMGKQRSWRQQSADRQIERNEKKDDTPKTRGVANKRDTKKWCKGKVGVAHKLVVRDRAAIGKDRGLPKMFNGWLVRYCSTCGKEIAHWMPPLSGHGLKARPKPDWVVEHLASKS